MSTATLAPGKRATSPLKIVVDAVGKLLLAALLFLIVWAAAVLNVQITDPQMADRLYGNASRRLELLQTVPASANGYTVLKKVLAGDAPADITAPYRVMGRYELGSREADTRELRRDPQQTERDVNCFLGVMPLIEGAFRHPQFVCPYPWYRGVLAEQPNYRLLKIIALGVRDLGYYYRLKGNPAGAMRCDLLALAIGARLSGQGGLLGQTVSVSIRSLALTALLDLVSQNVLKEGQYRALLARVGALPDMHGDFARALDQEYAIDLATFDLLRTEPAARRAMLGQPRNARGSNFVEGGLLSFSPYVDREKKVYINWYLAARPALINGAPCGPVDGGKPAWATCSLLASRMVPNVGRAAVQADCVEGELAALRLITALQAWRLEKGSYPGQLDDLVPGALQSMPVDAMSPDGKWLYAATEGGFRLDSISPRYALVRRKSPRHFYPYQP